MQEGKYIWMDGEFVKWNEAKVHVLTHSLHYGVSVFEGIRCYKTAKGSVIFRLKEHMQRLLNSAKIMYMDIRYSLDELVKAVVETVKKNEYQECYIRPIAFRGYGDMGVYPKNNPIVVAIAVWPWGKYLGEEAFNKGARIKTSSYTRYHPNTQLMRAKMGGNYSNGQLAKIEAVKDGYDEAILLTPEGYVTEGSGENIFIVKNKVLYTPFAVFALDGITKDSIIHIAEDLGIKVVETILSRDHIYIADEAFLCGTASEITPIRELDHRSIGTKVPGEITLKLKNEFFKIIDGENPKYKEWLTYIQ
jgi:branched-chain amino acid aminotransferase